ncbi:MAG: hypothetical protein AAGE89_12560 [Pseudomonadota bacterium]
MATTNITLSDGTPQAVADAGEVTFTAIDHGIEWAVNTGAAAPTIARWHIARFNEDRSMVIATGERLWLRGSAPETIVAVTAENAV